MHASIVSTPASTSSFANGKQQQNNNNNNSSFSAAAPNSSFSNNNSFAAAASAASPLVNNNTTKACVSSSTGSNNSDQEKRDVFGFTQDHYIFMMCNYCPPGKKRRNVTHTPIEFHGRFQCKTKECTNEKCPKCHDVETVYHPYFYKRENRGICQEHKTTNYPVCPPSTPANPHNKLTCPACLTRKVKPIEILKCPYVHENELPITMEMRKMAIEQGRLDYLRENDNGKTDKVIYVKAVGIPYEMLVNNYNTGNSGSNNSAMRNGAAPFASAAAGNGVNNVNRFAKPPVAAPVSVASGQQQQAQFNGAAGNGYAAPNGNNPFNFGNFMDSMQQGDMPLISRDQKTISHPRRNSIIQDQLEPISPLKQGPSKPQQQAAPALQQFFQLNAAGNNNVYLSPAASQPQQVPNGKMMPQMNPNMPPSVQDKYYNLFSSKQITTTLAMNGYNSNNNSPAPSFLESSPKPTNNNNNGACPDASPLNPYQSFFSPLYNFNSPSIRSFPKEYKKKMEMLATIQRRTNKLHPVSIYHLTHLIEKVYQNEIDEKNLARHPLFWESDQTFQFLYLLSSIAHNMKKQDNSNSSGSNGSTSTSPPQLLSSFLLQKKNIFEELDMNEEQCQRMYLSVVQNFEAFFISTTQKRQELMQRQEQQQQSNNGAAQQQQNDSWDTYHSEMLAILTKYQHHSQQERSSGFCLREMFDMFFHFANYTTFANGEIKEEVWRKNLVEYFVGSQAETVFKGAECFSYFVVDIWFAIYKEWIIRENESLENQDRKLLERYFVE